MFNSSSLAPYYLRVYAFLALVALGVTLLGGALVLGLNAVRHQAFLEDTPEPLMRWLSNHPVAVRQLAASDTGARLRLLPMDAVSLNDVAEERLAHGQVLARDRGDGIYLYRLMNAQGILEIRVENFYRQIAELVTRTLRFADRHGFSRDNPDALTAFGARLGVLARPLESTDALPGDNVLRQVVEQDLAYYQPGRRAAARTFSRMTDGTLIEVRHPTPFQFWAWPMILLAGILVALSLGVVVYYLLAQLHDRLRSIEGAVSRIARGELDARVGSGDLSIAGRLGDAFNRMADHIQRLVGVQREMIHGVSHELRTPVARIRFGVQMIEDCDDPDMLRSQLSAIDSDIQELDELIDEILTYARLEQGGPIMAVQRTDIVEIVEQVIREQQSTRPDLSINATIPDAAREKPWAEAEPRYIHRAIQNLVGNATRYASTRVLVECYFDDQTMRIDVQDDGAGIPEEDWDKVFTAFARLDDSRTRKSGGYGLGLSIVRRILYWHGGQAFVGRSEELGGACFTLVWPRHQATGNAEEDIQ
jgi:two-component system sensor histidine kinase RstB